MLRENVVEGIRMVEDAYVNWFLVEEGRKCPEPVRRRARQIAPLDEEPKRFGHPFARCVGLHGVPREQERP